MATTRDKIAALSFGDRLALVFRALRDKGHPIGFILEADLVETLRHHGLEIRPIQGSLVDTRA